jgi:hypothetical protein
MIVLFWVLQVLLASVLIVPLAIVAIGGGEGFREFAQWIVGTLLWVGIASGLAQMLRINHRVGVGVLVLLIGLSPVALALWALISFGQGPHR